MNPSIDEINSAVIKTQIAIASLKKKKLLYSQTTNHEKMKVT